MALKILLTGGSGRLGREIKAQFPNVYAPTHYEMNLLDENEVSYTVAAFKPDYVIHCGALTNVAIAEKEQRLCWAINVYGTKYLVEACEKLKQPVHFTYISTACVFRGDRGNYDENDVPYPSNFYGLTKLLGETIVKESSIIHWLIVRTNFVGREPWRYERAFTDRWGTYLYADEVARLVMAHVQARTTGIVHVCGKEKISMYDLARKTSPNVKPMTLKDYYILNPDSPTLTKDMSLCSRLHV